MAEISSARAWHGMIALKILLLLAVLSYKFVGHYPQIQYQHLLVDYHFGFIKRALLGPAVGIFVSKVAVWQVYLLGCAMLILAISLFLAVFKKYFSFREQTMPLLVFTACSPCFFANFAQTIGYLDIFGCVSALILLLIPARSFVYVIAAAMMVAVLILIHQIHILMYAPTVATIVVIRYFLGHERSARVVAGSLAIVVALGVLFLSVQFFGVPHVPQATFDAYMASRVAQPTLPKLDSYIWYSQTKSEIQATWAIMGKNLLRFPIYALIIAAHAPLVSYFARTIRSIHDARHRRLVLIAMTLIGFGYLIIFATVFDYSRWISNWTVCMMLILFAIHALPRDANAPISTTDKTAVRCGWIVAAIPRVGTTIPF